ncbi:metallophosphoesterase [Paenibacillus sp. J5C_2022]|uniref:metallophosphoesterase n=1 Tax=Paenibacillus sp. J5C2022 TaxID=2977129 RepID=UPI0021D002B4|nr:metallophosphoesterase [Paenibacillus sp. J5C2022]MCU6709818.1 metallophosphoesterase [Paenibacillus sp. J5C2022]
MTLPANNNISSRLLVISDIHGHREGYLRLLQEAAYDPFMDQLVLLGDYIDVQKTATWDILDIMREQTAAGALAIPGNHELKLLALASAGKGSDKRTDYAEWIKSLPLHIAQRQYLFVHAGIRPGVPLAKQSEKDLTEIREAFYRYPEDSFARQMDSEEDGTASRRIVFGHTPTFKLGEVAGRLWRDHRRIGIDTGAKHFYRLTLLDLTNRLAYSCATHTRYRCSDFRVEALDWSRWED